MPNAEIATRDSLCCFPSGETPVYRIHAPCTVDCREYRAAAQRPRRKNAIAVASAATSWRHDKAAGALSPSQASLRKAEQ
jgi:hypothetical protein